MRSCTRSFRRNSWTVLPRDFRRWAIWVDNFPYTITSMASLSLPCSSYEPQRGIFAIQAHHRAGHPRCGCIPSEACPPVNPHVRKINVCGPSSTSSIRSTRNSGFSRWSFWRGSQTTSSNTSVLHLCVAFSPRSLNLNDRVNPTVVSSLISLVYTGTPGYKRSMHVS